jgi:transposase
MDRKPYKYLDIATRAQVVLLRSDPRYSNAEIEAITGCDKRNIPRLVNKAKERGWVEGKRLLDQHLEDAERSGRPRKATPETEETVLAYVRKSKATRSYNCDQIAKGSGTGLARDTVRRILRKHGFHKVKRTAKPGLTAAQKNARLEWCIEHRNTDWTRVCFSDETSVILGHRRGSDRVWRQPEEVNDPTCRKSRWSGFMTFMFWGCFSYNHKGPCFVWPEAETAAEKKTATQVLDEVNKEREEHCRNEWMLSSGLGRVKLARPGKTPGKPPIWRFTKANGKWVREKGKGGIDWWRYRVNVLQPLLIPFCKEHRLIIQEDGASCHKHQANQKLTRDSGLVRLPWPGNSPDLNMIEPAWPKLKRDSQKRDNWEYKSHLPDIWRACWNDLDQDQIRSWIDRIPRHIEQIIKLEGGNDYREGRMDRRTKGVNFKSVIAGGLETAGDSAAALSELEEEEEEEEEEEGSVSDSNSSEAFDNDWFMDIERPSDSEGAIDDI